MLRGSILIPEDVSWQGHLKKAESYLAGCDGAAKGECCEQSGKAGQPDWQNRTMARHLSLISYLNPVSMREITSL